MATDNSSVFESIEKRAKAATKTAEDKPAPAKVVQLPLWPEPVRAVPNGVLRSALFGAVAKGRRRFIDNQEIAAIDGVSVVYRGDRLDQGDLDAWEAVLHAVRSQELGSECHVSSYTLLKLMGVADTGKYRKILYNRIARLTGGMLTLKQGSKTYMGHLINWAAKDEDTQHWAIGLNPKLSALFESDQYTLIEWGVRSDLSNIQLAQWLRGFYSSHAKPFPIKIETLHKLCGSETSDMWKFAQLLRKALDALTAAYQAHGQDFSYTINRGLVSVVREASKSQRKHLTKRGRKPKAV